MSLTRISDAELLSGGLVLGQKIDLNLAAGLGVFSWQGYTFARNNVLVDDTTKIDAALLNGELKHVITGGQKTFDGIDTSEPVTSNVINKNGTVIKFSITNYGRFYRSEDGGDNFTEYDLSSQFPDLFFGWPKYGWAVNKTNGYIYVISHGGNGTRKYILVTKDDGKTWERKLIHNDISYAQGMCVDEDGYVYTIAYKNGAYRLYKSVNHADSFSEISSYTQNGFGHLVIGKNNRLIIAPYGSSNHRLVYSDDGAASFTTTNINCSYLDSLVYLGGDTLLGIDETSNTTALISKNNGTSFSNFTQFDSLFVQDKKLNGSVQRFKDGVALISVYEQDFSGGRDRTHIYEYNVATNDVTHLDFMLDANIKSIVNVTGDKFVFHPYAQFEKGFKTGGDINNTTEATVIRLGE